MSSYGDTPVAVHFDRDLVVTWAGPEAADVLSGRDPYERAAIHESGHVVAAWRFGRGTKDVLVRKNGTGVATFGPMGVSTESLETLRLGSKVSVIAEAPSVRPLSDARRAIAVSHMLRVDRKAARELVRVRRFEARLLVNRDAELIRAVAVELLRAGRLTGVEVEAVIAKTIDAARARRLKELGM